ncbi:FAS1 domain-containing protein [Sporodiniella umbellata]|nr:FAS1 domain-containing protein [Sporodiniella umbellata]
MQFFLLFVFLISFASSQRLLYEESEPNYQARVSSVSLFDRLAPDASLSTFMDVLTQVEDIFDLLNHTDSESRQQITVFCPVNQAFRQEMDIQAKKDLAAFLKNHVVWGKLDPKALTHVRSVDSLLPGQKIQIKHHFFSQRTVLNGHAVIQGQPVEAINGIAYKINHLLRPT